MTDVEVLFHSRSNEVIPIYICGLRWVRKTLMRNNGLKPPRVRVTERIVPVSEASSGYLVRREILLPRFLGELFRELGAEVRTSRTEIEVLCIQGYSVVRRWIE